MRQIPTGQLNIMRINGLDVREVYIPSRSKTPKSKAKNFVLMGGHHSSLEKLYPIADFLADFGNVHFPDMPGFGGAPSFLTINQPISIDSYADYINKYVRQKALRNIYWAPSSIATLYAVRALQKHPDLIKRTDKFLALVGLFHRRDFNLQWWKRHSINALARIFSIRQMHGLVNALLFKNPISMPIFMAVIQRVHKRFADVTPETRQDYIESERWLWQNEDHTTHARSTVFMLNADLENAPKLPFTMHNITTRQDQYFDQERMAISAQNLFDGYQRLVLNFDQHAPAYIVDKDNFAKMLTPDIIDLLKS